jgi:hypothetical protein
VLPAEGAYSLKLIDKGVAKEALAFLVLFQFPVELASALLAGRYGGLGTCPVLAVAGSTMSMGRSPRAAPS